MPLLYKEEIKDLLDILKTNPIYSTMEYRSYWFNTTPNLRMIFGEASRQERAEYRIKVVDHKTINLMWNHVNREQVEKRFQG